MFGSKVKDVGVIGLGIIGSRVADCLRRAEFNVFVWNRTARPVPGFVASPREIAEVAQVIQIFVRDAEALMEMMEQMQPALKKHHVVCCHSTVSAAAVKQAAAIAHDSGAGFLDAPFTGSKLAAQKGKLVYYVSGDARELEKITKVLEASSKKILPFGPSVGDATVLKIVTNLVSGAVVGALAEALSIAKAHGVEPSQLLEAFQGNANCSPLVTMKLPAMISGDYEAHFSLRNMLKDANYARELAAEKDLVTPVLDASAEVMEQAAAAGQEALDYSVIYENFARKSDSPAPGRRTKIRIVPSPERRTLRASAFEDQTESPAGSSDAPP